MKFTIKLLLSVLGIALLAVSAFASVISITTSMENIMMEGNSATSDFSLANSGDEAASNVRVSLILPAGFYAEPVYAGKIGAGSSFTGQFIITAGQNLSRGSYSIAVLTEYQDNNGYPFSSVHPNIINYGEITGSRITGNIETVILGEKGTSRLFLRLMNRDNKRHDITARLFLPNEITSPDAQKQVSVGPNEEKIVEFQVSNFGALIGSKYAVFAAVDYNDGLHYSGYSPGMIEIVKEDTTLIYVGIVAALVIVLLLVNIQKIKSMFRPKTQ